MMATLDSPDANIIDSASINWRWIVYPIAGVLIVLFGGGSIYLYLQSAQADREAKARQALIDAKTPAAMVQVADQFPGTTHAAIALIGAANASYDQKDYATAQKDYQRVADIPDLDATMKDSAQLGLASAFEATGKADDQAVSAYLAVANRGKASPFASYAYMAAAHIYERQHNTDKEKQYLILAAGIDNTSAFSQQAQRLLQGMGAPIATAPVLTPGP